MKKSANENSSTKCFSDILRRLLCTGNLQTHPSDQFIEANKKEKDDQRAEKCLDNVTQLAARSSSPGVVAKLMGLDSFPNTPLAPRDRTLGSYFRSRSANSIDFLSHFDPTRKGSDHHRHRRVRTSVSFRENDDYGLVLHLEKVDENAEYDQEESMMIKKRPKVKKSENLLEKKVTTKRPNRKLETSQKKDFHGKNTRLNLKERRPIIKPINTKEALIESKCLKTKNKKQSLGYHKVHSQCSLKKIHPENNLSGEVAPGMSSHSDNGEVRAIIRGKSKIQKMENKETCYYKRMVDDICRLTEEDVKENFKLNFEDFEEICQQFGQEIFEVLLRQFVDELVLFMGQRVNKD
ncbi:hypothetical protein BUALT_Bualt11G0129800 [Buddleja alternifolia]|uniref:DUF3741 domain-containing protein n=1 Tax=Buddleja alternifolia TaxID=168488 RepID=A0AAV6X2P0_9LAMI|nr:hypothetical protein BUALT_Bualt11G0129800 [Buddleja alternifolia]